MIFAKDKGRMCNNILQYGHVYAWAREHGRRSVSMRFCYKYQYFKICHTPWHYFLTYLVAKYGAKWGLIPTVAFHDQEEDMATKEQWMLRHKTFVVEGWYVRFYDLFTKYKQEIIDLFTFDSDITAKTEDFMGPKADGCVRLGVHIRRGDYKTWLGGRYYYDDCVYIDYIRQFKSLFPDRQVTVYICSNDPQLDRKAYTSQLKDMDVVFPAGGQADDLCLLSRCDYLIGAPSTFSLVASMYRDIPLCWMEEAHTSLSRASFKPFDVLFRNIK